MFAPENVEERLLFFPSASLLYSQETYLYAALLAHIAAPLTRQMRYNGGRSTTAVKHSCVARTICCQQPPHSRSVQRFFGTAEGTDENEHIW